MNQRLYQEYLDRLTPETPFKICRICIQETNNLISTTDTEWSEIRSLYEYVSKIKVCTAYYLSKNPLNSTYRIICVLIPLKGYGSNGTSLLRVPRMLQYVARN